MVVFDELDEVTPEAKALALERIGHSDCKRVIELLNPSLPDYGIDEAYRRSYQRHRTVRCTACGTWTALEKEFPPRLNQDVRIILPRPDGTFYRACPRYEAELDLAAGGWVADFPSCEIHGCRISQLFSSKVDPGEILHEYQTTRYQAGLAEQHQGGGWAARAGWERPAPAQAVGEHDVVPVRCVHGDGVRAARRRRNWWPVGSIT